MRRAQEHASHSPFPINTLSKWKQVILSEDIPVLAKRELSQEDRNKEMLLICLNIQAQVENVDTPDEDIDFVPEDELWDKLMECAEEVATVREIESQLAGVSEQQKQMRDRAIFETVKILGFLAGSDEMSKIFPRYDSPFL
jgi:hypothetical protein